MGITLRDFGNFAVGAIERDREITKEDLAIKADELTANRDFLIKQKEKKYDKELEQYYKEKEKFDTINQANKMYDLKSIDARTYAATILPITNPNWKNLDEKTKQLNINNFDGKTIDYKLIGNPEEISKQAALINNKINSVTSEAIKNAKGDRFLINKILGQKKKAEADLLEEVENKIKAADAVKMSEQEVNQEYVGKDVRVSSSLSAFSNDPDADKYQTEWSKQRDKISFDILNGSKALRFLNSAAISGGSDELSYKFDKTDSRITGMNAPSITNAEALRYMFNQIKDNNDTMIQHYNTVTKYYGNIGKTWNEENIFKQMEKEIPTRAGNIKEDITIGFGGNIRLTTVVPLSIVPIGAVNKDGKPVDKAQMKLINNEMNNYIIEKTKVLKNSGNYKDLNTQQIATMVYKGLYEGDESYLNEFYSQLSNKDTKIEKNISVDDVKTDSNDSPKSEITYSVTREKGKDGLAINNKFRSWEEIEAADAVKDLPEEQRKKYENWKNQQNIIKSNPMA